jgi:tetrapyrrole methylase family protein/MazG family protein
MIRVLGLGPAGPELMGAGIADQLRGAAHAFLRTRRHPAATLFDQVPSFDAVYEESDTFDEVYRSIVERLIEAALDVAERGGVVAYAVPGSPLIAERTVELLLGDDRVAVEVVPALSFLDLAWARLAIDPIAQSVHLVDATAFAEVAAGGSGPMLVAQCWSSDVLSNVKLGIGSALDEHATGSELVVTLLHHLGLPDEHVVDVPWWDLDRTIEPDHLTSLWIPPLGTSLAGEMVRLEELVRTLRARCPWDRVQTHGSLARHLLEESYEALDAIESVTVLERAADDDARASSEATAALCEELGDVLFQVVFHSVLASEAGQFDLADVANGVHRKLVGRHPHVFGDVVVEGPDEVVANWELLKKAEKGRTSVTDGIPSAMPALALAAKLQRKAEKHRRSTSTLGLRARASPQAIRRDKAIPWRRFWRRSAP